MKIGDRVFVRGYIDEIRKDTVIVRNNGGYFGTVLSEVTGELPSAQHEPQWIPTKVKPDPDLPEDDMSGYFLVTLHTYGNIGFNMDEYEVKKMRWDRVNGWGFPVHSPAWIEEALTQEVLAWKPCPEPYREDGVE